MNSKTIFLNKPRIMCLHCHPFVQQSFSYPALSGLLKDGRIEKSEQAQFSAHGPRQGPCQNEEKHKGLDFKPQSVFINAVGLHLHIKICGCSPDQSSSFLLLCSNQWKFMQEETIILPHPRGLSCSSYKIRHSQGIWQS